MAVVSLIAPRAEEGDVTGPAFVPPNWRKPAPLGYGNAIDSVGTAGSSLLAGFSLAPVIVVTSEAGTFRWPGASGDSRDVKVGVRGGT